MVELFITSFALLEAPGGAAPVSGMSRSARRCLCEWLCARRKSPGSNLCNLLLNFFSLWELPCPGVTGDVHFKINNL